MLPLAAATAAAVAAAFLVAFQKQLSAISARSCHLDLITVCMSHSTLLLALLCALCSVIMVLAEWLQVLT